jgi:hypothetical protein
MWSLRDSQPGGRLSQIVTRTLSRATEVASRLSNGDGNHRIEYNMKFELLSTLVLFLDTVCIGYQVDESLQSGYELHSSNDANLRIAKPTHWQVLEVCFVSCYALELVIRGVTERAAFLFGRERFWNLFDLFSVMVSTVGVLLALSESSRILRLIRITKGLRVLRALRFCRSLRAMVFAIASSLMSLVWALCVMFLIMYFFTVVFATAVADTLERTSASNDSGPDVRAFLPYYRSLLDTTLYLFMSITGGIDWQTMALPLLDVDPVLMGVFVLYICFMSFGVLNVVIGIFVSKAKDAADRDRDILTENRLREERDAMRRMRNIFREADTDGDNVLSWDEFSAYLQDNDAAVFFSSLGLDVNVAQALFVLLDVNDDDSVNIDEFVHGCLRLKGDARSIDVNMLLYQSDKMQHQFMECMDSLGRELSRLAGALDLSPCEVATAKVRKSIDKAHIGLAALLKNPGDAADLGESRGSRLSRLSRGHTNISMASQGKKIIHRLVNSVGRHLHRQETTPVQPVDERLQGQ